MYAFEDIEIQPKPAESHYSQRNQRATIRYPTSQLAELQYRDQTAVVEAIDVSSSGARCRIVSGFAPLDDDAVKLVFLTGTQRAGKICWSSSSDFGIQFDDDIDEPEDLTHFEHLGVDYYQSIIRLQKKRQARASMPGPVFEC